ncbi:MAG: Acg family FMN-binding oxidoreductase [Novosphingobium sp.]
MALSRRKFVAAAVGGLGLALVGGAWRATRLPEHAADPWRLAGPPPADVRLDAFRHAILAPNPHNRQPWLIRLEGDDRAMLSCDLAKRLPATDPFDRQTTIGFGCFIELARIAAAERGTRLEVEPFPLGEPGDRLDARPLAALRFVPDPASPRDPLFARIVHRRSNKDEYDTGRAVPPALAAAVAADEVRWSVDPAYLAKFRALVREAVRVEQFDQPRQRESVDLIRIGANAVDAQPDGIDLTGPLPEALHLAGLLTHETLADPASTAFRSGVEMLDRTYGSVPAAVWVVTPGNSRADQLEAGRHYVRANLRATALGLGMHPMSQALQEYPAMARLLAAAHELHGAKGAERVQMLARIGYAPPVEPAPRWPLERHLVA